MALNVCKDLNSRQLEDREYSEHGDRLGFRKVPGSCVEDGLEGKIPEESQ